MKELLNTIYKRKSIRKYDKNQSLSAEQLNHILTYFNQIQPLDPDIKIHLEIVKREETSSKYGEYCLLFYSEKKPFYLLNAGYILEQIDLFLESHDIGVCWQGMAHPKNKSFDGLQYVVMIAFGQSNPLAFRQSITEFTRKDHSTIWSGTFDEEIKEMVRLAPSACNTQTWRFVSTLETVSIYRDSNVRSIIPKSTLSYLNQIDLGIVLCFFDIALLSKDYHFKRTLIDKKIEREFVKIAEYQIKK